MYSCVASNETGESRASAELRVLDPNDSSARLLNELSLPEISFTQLPGQPAVRQISCDTFQLSWSPAALSPISQADYEMTGYTIEYFTSSGRRWHVAATNVQSTHHRLQQLAQQNEFVFLVRVQLGCRSSSSRCQPSLSEPSRVSQSVRSGDCSRPNQIISPSDSLQTNGEHLEKIRAELPLVQTVLLRARPHNITALQVAWRVQQAQLANIRGLLLFYRPYPHIRLPMSADGEDSHRLQSHHHHRHPEAAAYTNPIDPMASLFPLSVDSFTDQHSQAHLPNVDHMPPSPHHHHSHHSHHPPNHRLDRQMVSHDAMIDEKTQHQRLVRHPLLSHRIPVMIDSASKMAGISFLDYRVQLINMTTAAATAEGEQSDSALITGLKPFTGYQVFAIAFHRLGMFAWPSNLVVGHTAEALPNRAPTRIQIRVLESAAIPGLATMPMNGLNLNAMQSMASGQSETASLETTNYQLPSHQLHSLLTNNLVPEHFSRRLTVELTWSHLPTDHWRGMQRGYRLDFQLVSSIVRRSSIGNDPVVSGAGFVLHVPTHHLMRNGHLLPNNTIQLTNLTTGDSYLLRISACTSAGCGVASVPVPLKVLPGFSYTLLADVNSGNVPASRGPSMVDHPSPGNNSPIAVGDDLSSNSADGPMANHAAGGGNHHSGPEVISTSMTKNSDKHSQVLLDGGGLRPMLLLLVGCLLLFVFSLMLILSFVLMKRKNTTRLKKAVEGYMSVHLPDSGKVDCKLTTEKPHSFSQIMRHGCGTGNTGWTSSSNQCGGVGGNGGVVGGGSTSGHSTQSSECNSATVAGVGRRMTTALPPLPTQTNATGESNGHYAEVEGHSMVTFGSNGAAGYTTSGNPLDGNNPPYGNAFTANLHSNSVHCAEPYATTTLMMLNSAFNQERELIQDGGSSDQSTRHFNGQQPLSQSGYASAVYQPSASILMNHHQQLQSQTGNGSADAGGNSDSGSDVYGISRPNLSDHFRNSSVGKPSSQFHSSVESVTIGNGLKESRMPLNNFTHLNHSFNSHKSNHSFSGGGEMAGNQSAYPQFSGYHHNAVYGNQTDKVCTTEFTLLMQLNQNIIFFNQI